MTCSAPSTTGAAPAWPRPPRPPSPPSAPRSLETAIEALSTTLRQTGESAWTATVRHVDGRQWTAGLAALRPGCARRPAAAGPEPYARTTSARGRDNHRWMTQPAPGRPRHRCQPRHRPGHGRARRGGGWDVAVGYRTDSGAADAVVGSAPAAGADAVAVPGDVIRGRRGVGVRGRRPALRPTDALVANAGIVSPLGRVEDMTEERIAEVLRVNVTGTLLCAGAAVRRLSRRGHGGRGGVIVTVSSRAAVLGGTGRVRRLRREQGRRRRDHGRPGRRGRRRGHPGRRRPARRYRHGDPRAGPARPGSRRGFRSGARARRTRSRPPSSG